MSKNLLDNGTVLTLGLVGAVAAASALVGRRGSSNDETEWAYSSVKPKSLPRVRRNGVQPRYGKLRFHPDARRAKDWSAPGDVIVRFPWPYDWWDDHYCDTVLTQDGGVCAASMFTEQAAPPESVEVMQDGRWVPLVQGSRASELLDATGVPERLPFAPSRYFKGGQDVPLERLRATRAREKGIHNARVYMWKSYKGEYDPRKPISIRPTGDGMYEVLDGNSTYANAVASGWPSIRAQVVTQVEGQHGSMSRYRVQGGMLREVPTFAVGDVVTFDAGGGVTRTVTVTARDEDEMRVPYFLGRDENGALRRGEDRKVISVARGSRAVSDDDFSTAHLRGEAKKIAEAIKKLIREDKGGEPWGGGSKAFRTPARHRKMGFDVPKGTVLVLGHDGGDLAPYLNRMYDYPEGYNKMRDLLNRMGYWTEMQNSAETVVYAKRDR